MALSDQLTDLAGRTKKLEDSAAAAREKDRADLEKQRENLHSTIEADAKKIKSDTASGQADIQAWWTDTTARMEKKRAEIRTKIEDRKAERKVERANQNANDAADYAAEMLRVANYVVETAEYAVVDAAIARSEADALVATR